MERSLDFSKETAAAPEELQATGTVALPRKPQLVGARLFHLKYPHRVGSMFQDAHRVLLVIP
jgi:hypothetical protein